MKKASKILTILCVSSFLLTGCGLKESGDKLLMAHSHNENHPTHVGLTYLSQEMEKDTKYSFNIYPNGQLGANRDVIELVKAGVLDVAKVSASSLEQFNPAYAIFSLPYVFQSTEHYFDVMDNSEAVQEIFNSTEKDGFIAIGWHDSGSRSIYTTKDGIVNSPSDLKGLKIRTQDSPTSIEMIRNMGGSATPMSAGEVYTSLQQGVIDGAENNETVLVDGGHGEVAKSYTYTQHQYSPDIIIISTETWNKMSLDEQDILVKNMKKSTEYHKEVWANFVEVNIEAAKNMGVEFYTIDKTPFIEAVKPQHEAFKELSKENSRYLEEFLSYVK